MNSEIHIKRLQLLKQCERISRHAVDEYNKKYVYKQFLNNIMFQGGKIW